MSKYLNRLKARLAMQKLEESAKQGRNWIVSKKLILEAEDGDLELEPGDNVEVGANDDGDMVVGSKAAVVIITDPEVAEQVADAVVNADELSDVQFVTKDAMDALNDGEPLDDVVDSLGDEETAPADSEEAPAGEEEVADIDTKVEVPEVSADKKESVENKYAKFSLNRMNPKKASVCESVLVEDDAKEVLNLFTIKTFGTYKESFDDFNKFAARVSELNGSIKPGKREVALTEAGEVMGSYDTEANSGDLYPENPFENEEAYDNFQEDDDSLINQFDSDPEWDTDPEYDEDMYDDPEEFGDDFAQDEADDENVLESCLKNYEESNKSGSDYMTLVEGLSSKKIGLKESAVAKIVSTFDNRSLKECCRVYDSKYGKFVACFKESADANNFISETKEESRFTKRFFG